MPRGEKCWVPHAKFVLVKMAALAGSHHAVYSSREQQSRNGGTSVLTRKLWSPCPSQVTEERDFESSCLCDPTAQSTAAMVPIGCYHSKGVGYNL